MKKVLAFTMAACMACGMFAGCGAASSTASSVSSEAASTEAASTADAAASTAAAPEEKTGPVSLSVSWWGGDSRHEATQNALNAYTAANPDVTIKTSYGAWTGWEDKMSTALYAGTAEDLIQVNWNWIYNYDNSGKTFVDLNTLSDYIDLTQFDQAALDQCTVDGKLSCLPVAMTGRVFYWNESSFEKAGISVPKSYDDLIAAGAAFKEKLGDDSYPLVLGELDRTIFMVWALECKYGKDWVVDGQLNYSQEEIEEGLQMLLDLEAAHAIPSIQTIAGDGAESLDKNPKWMDGRYAGIFEWDSSAKKFSSALNEGQSFVVGDYLTGVGDNKGGFTKVSLGFSITQSCADPVAAAKVLNYLLNEPEGAKLMASERGIPLSKAGLAACKEDNLLDSITAEANEKALANCTCALDPTFEDAKLKASDGVYYDVMAGLSYGDYDVATAAETLIDGITTVLAG